MPEVSGYHNNNRANSAAGLSSIPPALLLSLFPHSALLLHSKPYVVLLPLPFRLFRSSSTSPCRYPSQPAAAYSSRNYRNQHNKQSWYVAVSQFRNVNYKHHPSLAGEELSGWHQERAELCIPCLLTVVVNLGDRSCGWIH